jgi:hypothetical protein
MLNWSNTWDERGPWYETSGPSEKDALKEMKNSYIVRCLLSRESNTEKENEYFKEVLSSLFESHNHTFKTITYDSIRRNPRWEELSDQILKEEVIAEKPYGSWRGWGTFIVGKLRKKYLLRVIREIWGYYVLSTKFVPLWIDYNYRPHEGRKGYIRTSAHYASINKC